MLDNQPESTKVLGITATPRRDADGINMANEVAQRLGYTNREAVSGKHIAMNMSLTNAIRMGLVVNPKLVSCAYSLKTDGSLDELKDKIDQIEDIQDRNEKLEEYEALRRNVENAEGIPQILQANVKKGGKYIVFLPIVEDLEDEDGNVIGRKKGKDKIADYEKQIAEYFKGSDIIPNFHSMLGEYGDKDNSRRLEEFQNSNSEETEFMLVMNKANEGLHLDKLDGMIWLRPMDENSKILYLQQLGRVIYAEDPDNPTKDDDRPVVIDLVNNTLKVNWENEITEQDDIQMLNLILDWTERHNGTLPDINSSDKEETGYATVLKEIQNKYKEYLKNEFEGLNEKQIEEVQEIVRLGSTIDLWQINLPERNKRDGESKGRSFSDGKVGLFELTGLLKDFVELKDTVDGIEKESAISEILRIASILKSEGVKLEKIQLSKIVGRRQKKILLKEIEQDGVNIQRIIEKHKLDGNFKYGQQVAMLREAYKGKKKCRISEQEKEIANELGLIPRQEKSVIAQTIEIAKILYENGVDLAKIQLTDRKAGKVRRTTLKDIEQDGIDIRKIINEYGLDENFTIGRNIQNTRRAYIGQGKGYIITEQEKEEAKKLGLIPKETKSAIAETLEIVKLLSENGVDITLIQTTTRKNGKKIGTVLRDIEQNGINIEKIISENNLDSNFPIGQRVKLLRSAYKGNGNCKITEQEKEEAKKLGIIPEETKSAIAETLEIVKILKEAGVNIDELRPTKTIQRKTTFILLKDVKQDGIDIEDIIRKNNLDGNFALGKRIANTRNAYNGIGTYVITEEEKEEAKRLGIITEQGPSMVQETIAIVKILKREGVDLSQIQFRYRRKGKEYFPTLNDIKQEGIDIQKIIDENNLDGEFPFGRKMERLKQVYRGTGTGAITDDEKREIEELEIFKNKKRSSKEIAQASISSLTDIEMSDGEDAALKELVERTKEGGMNLDEQS